MPCSVNPPIVAVVPILVVASADAPLTVSEFAVRADAVVVASVSVPENVLLPAKVCVVVLTMPSVVPFA